MNLRIGPVMLGALAALALFPSTAAVGAVWTLKGGQPAPGEAAEFDFSEKRVVFRDTKGREHPVPVEDLSADSRWRLLVSPAFARSFPEDRWTGEEIRYLMLAVSVPSACLLVSFYGCALLLLKNPSPFQALAGWFGSALIGGFLMGFYFFLSERTPGSATPILAVGFLISTAALSFYVSIVYRTTTFQALKLLVLHLFGAFLFLLFSVLALLKTTQVFDLEIFMKQSIMIPVGLLPKE
jgi:hypothetical protein